MSDDQVEGVNEKIVILLFVECFTRARKRGFLNENIKRLACSVRKRFAVIVFAALRDADNWPDYHLKNTLFFFSPSFFSFNYATSLM